MSPIVFGGASGGSQPVQVATVDLTASQIRTTHSSPPTIIAAPGSGKLIVPVCAALYLEAGVAPFQFASGGGSLQFIYDSTDALQTNVDPGPPFLVQDAAGTFLNSAADLVSVLYIEPQNLSLNPIHCVGKPIIAFKTNTDAGGPIAASTLNSGGSGYAPGDSGTVSGAGFGDATYAINSVGGGGAVATYTITAPGTFYEPAMGIATTVGTGGGDGLFTINVTQIAPTGNSTLRAVIIYYVTDVS